MNDIDVVLATLNQLQKEVVYELPHELSSDAKINELLSLKSDYYSVGSFPRFHDICWPPLGPTGCPYGEPL